MRPARSLRQIAWFLADPSEDLRLGLPNRGRGYVAGWDATNVLKDFPTGEKKFGDVTFVVGRKLIMLGSTAQKGEPAKVEGIPVGRAAHKLHFLHANGYGGGPNTEGSDWFVKDGTAIGSYTVHYDDKTTAEIPIVYGEHT